jgi:2-polyprenyl-3-methyl-5-hydroxy-6-metoxy-1,4-benzoquinol methylase
MSLMPSTDCFAGVTGDRFALGPLRIDVAALCEKHSLTTKEATHPGFVPLYRDGFHRYIYRRPQIPLQHRVHAKALLRRTGVDDLWLKHFGAYWSKFGGRPLWHPSDFFFLRSFYRLRQSPPQSNTIQDATTHLAAWQDADYLFGLFNAVLKETFFSEYETLRILQSIKPRWTSLLEYGAGSAPIASSIIQHGYWRRGCTITLADLATLSFHYASYKFRQCSNVDLMVLRPEDEFRLVAEREFDVICCCQVFEHMNEPLKTVQRFHQLLATGGVLLFDYIRAEGKGLDSMQGVLQRDSVLDYIGRSFRIEHGAINKTQSMGLTLARKIP